MSAGEGPPVVRRVVELHHVVVGRLVRSCATVHRKRRAVAGGEHHPGATYLSTGFLTRPGGGRKWAAAHALTERVRE